jgi:sulfite reductase (ferredoxin)
MIKTLPEEIIREIEAFGREVKRLLNHEIPEEKFKKFRLQQGVYGQRQKGVQMVRVKIPSGFINAEQFRALANVIEQYSTGKGHVTTRQDIQFHFVKLANMTSVLYQLAESGLTTREACGNTVRNVTSCHLAGGCPTELFDVSPFAEKVAYYLLRNPINQDLPRKFKISFSGCRSECGLAAIHDIGFIAETRSQNGVTEYGFRTYVGGGLGSSPKLAKLYSDFLPFLEVLPTCEAILKIFDANGDRKTRSKARMKFVLEKWGMAKFKEEVAKEMVGLRERGVVYPPLPAPQFPLRGLTALPMVNSRQGGNGNDYETWIQTNQVAAFDNGRSSVQIRLPLGDITVAQLRGLADLVDQFSPESVRTTHQQNILLQGVRSEQLPDLYEGLSRIGLGASGAEKAVDVIACPGADSCQLALTSSMGVGAALSDTFSKECVGDVPGLRIRISGCPNSCAHHHIAGIGLHGVAKKVHGKLAPHYQLHLGGGINADHPALGIAKIKLPAKNIPAATMEIISIFRENRKEGELFNDFVRRYGADPIAAKLVRFTDLPAPEVSPESYQDYNSESDFHLDDLGPGECAGTMIDLLENYLRTSRQALEQVSVELAHGRYAPATDFLKTGILRAARALLIPFGIDSSNDEEVLKEFQHKVVEQGIVSERFESFTSGLAKWKEMDQTAESLRGVLERAEQFLMECNEAYDQMDASMKLKKSDSAGESTSSISAGVTDSGRKIDIRLDLAGVACPMNFVKTKLQLEEMETGQVLEVLLDDGAPKENVPRSVQAEGHKILELAKTPNDLYKLVIEKV